MFYLTLPSNSSSSYFPGNVVSDYTTKLPKEINLEGDWEVGLAEISYPHSWYTVPILQNDYFISYRNDGITLLMHADPGYYKTPKILIKNLMSSLTRNLERQGATSEFDLKFDDMMRRVRLQINKGFSGDLRFSRSLGKLLGLGAFRYLDSTNTIGQKIADTRQGFYSMYLYCNIVEPRVVGDVLAPLLSVIPVRGDNGDYIHQRYEKIQYYPLLTKNFGEIHITLRDDQGQRVKFEGGKVVVTLHFRRRKLSDL